MSLANERVSRRTLLRTATAGAAGVAFLTGAAHANAAPTLRAALAAARLQDATPVVGGSLSATLSTADISGFKTWQADTSNESAAWSAVFDTLVEYDEQYQITGGLFESWKTDDAITWTFAVRQGVTWHDGQPLVAKHFIDYFDTILAADSGAGTSLTSIFAGSKYEAVDDHTVKLALPQANAALLDGLSANWLSRTSDFDAAKPIGTGPFAFVSWTRNQQVDYQKNPTYWKPGLPYLDKLTLKMVPDQTTAINLLTTGEVDAVASVDFPKVKSLSSNSSVQMIQVPEQFRLLFHYLLTKTDTAPWNNAKVRQALNFAVDRPAMLAATLGYGSVRSNPVAKGSWAFDASAPAYDTRNLDQAKQLMTEAGYTAGQTAFKTTLKYWKEWSQMPQIAQIVQANLADIGIEVELQLLTINDWVDSVENKVDYEMALTALAPRWDPSDQIGNAYKSTDGAALKWSNADFDKAYAAGAATADQTARQTAYFQCQQIALKECPGTVLNEAPFFAAASTKVQGIVEHNRAFQLYHKAWVKS